MNYSHYIEQIINRLNKAYSDVDIEQILTEVVAHLQSEGLSDEKILNYFQNRPIPINEFQGNTAMIENQKRYEEILKVVLQKMNKKK